MYQFYNVIDCVRLNYYENFCLKSVYSFSTLYTSRKSGDKIHFFVGSEICIQNTFRSGQSIKVRGHDKKLHNHIERGEERKVMRVFIIIEIQ